MTTISDNKRPGIDIILESQRAFPVDQIWQPGDLLRVEKTLLMDRDDPEKIAPKGMDGTPVTHIGYALYLGTDQGAYKVVSVSDIPREVALMHLEGYKRVAQHFMSVQFKTPGSNITDESEDYLKTVYDQRLFLEEALRFGLEPKFHEWGSRVKEVFRLEFYSKPTDTDDKRLREVKYIIKNGKIELHINCLEYGSIYREDGEGKEFDNLKAAVKFYEKNREFPAFFNRPVCPRGGGGGKR
jgi:hypothetical protein